MDLRLPYHFFLFLLAAVIVSPMLPYKWRSNKKLPKYPVIIIPGDAGSQLEANLTGKPFVVHYICEKQSSDFFDLWLNLELFVPLVIDCWVDNMMLVFNSTTGLSSNMPGVEIRVPGYGGTNTIEWLDKSKASTGMYFFTVVDKMVSWGYSRGKNVMGAPFDWRKSPNELYLYFDLLKATIETTYRYSGHTKVIILAHSMGNPLMLYFYNHIVDQEWKDKYIESHVSLAAPWGGSMQIVRLFASGYNMNYYRVILPPSKLRAMQRSFTSSAFLFPSTAVWNDTDILASANGKNYTVANVEEFFTDINYLTGWQQYKVAGQLNGNLDAPGVKLHCLYGTGIDTPEIFTWSRGYFPDYPPNILNGDGDGTVNRKSAEVCMRWNERNNGGKPVTIHEIPGAEHMEILHNPTAIEIVRKAIFGLL
ncbi:Lecithin:cholesterol acyltransferase [Dictyocaulus viviparus]|uniref:Lecithin:cholesterol acyltransferase n=1 Tax=Dictyocaulus viviparus TaxID=29172 RepID=A0A0D8Y363_DICVI|nr:Lecithin:cholesterol acyltransferase [Dictyocaulus viviparus]